MSCCVPRTLGFDGTDAGEMFKEIDKDGSGEVSYPEFEFW